MAERVCVECNRIVATAYPKAMNFKSIVEWREISFVRENTADVHFYSGYLCEPCAVNRRYSSRSRPLGCLICGKETFTLVENPDNILVTIPACGLKVFCCAECRKRGKITHWQLSVMGMAEDLVAENTAAFGEFAERYNSDTDDSDLSDTMWRYGQEYPWLKINYWHMILVKTKETIARGESLELPYDYEIDVFDRRAKARRGIKNVRQFQDRWMSGDSYKRQKALNDAKEEKEAVWKPRKADW